MHQPIHRNGDSRPARSWNISPKEFLANVGQRTGAKGSWLVLDACPFCGGGDHGDRRTFIVHAADGNYACSRAKCGARGTFWGLIEHFGHDPKDHFGERKAKAKGYIYGR